MIISESKIPSVTSHDPSNPTHTRPYVVEKEEINDQITRKTLRASVSV